TATGSGRIFPATGRAVVGAAGECARRAEEDQEVGPRGAMLDVPDVELDPLVPRELRAAVDLRPARDAGLHLQPARLPRRVALDLVAQRRPRADQRHLAAQDVPELRQLVEGEPAQHAPDSRDARLAAVRGVAGAFPLRPDAHRAQLQELEVDAVLADAHLAIEDRPTVRELDRDGR